jgi:hypothetical protein
MFTEHLPSNDRGIRSPIQFSKLLLALASTMIFASEFHGHILLSDGSGILQITSWAVHTKIGDRPTDSPLKQNGPYKKPRIQQFFYCSVCIRYRWNVFTDKHRLMGGIYEVRS